MANYGYVEVSSSGFPLKTSEPFNDRVEAAKIANAAYQRAVNIGTAHGIRFGRMDDEGRVRGRLATVKSWRKYSRGPFQ